MEFNKYRTVHKPPVLSYGIIGLCFNIHSIYLKVVIMAILQL